MTDTRRRRDEEHGRSLGRRLRDAREFLGLSQEAVAEWMKIPRASISAIESGKRRVTAMELADFAKLYRVSTSELLGECPEQADEKDETIDALFRAARSLPDEDKQQVLQFAKFLKSAGARPDAESR